MPNDSIPPVPQQHDLPHHDVFADPRVQMVEDVTDPRLKHYIGMTDMALRKLREPVEGIYMAESAMVIRRALAVGHQPLSILVPARWLHTHRDVLNHPACKDIPIYAGDEEMLRSLTGFNLHRGAVAAMLRPQLPTLEQVSGNARRLAVLEDIVDHTNVGAMFRSAAGLGVDGIVVTPRCADPFYRRSVRVSMGSVFQVPWTRLDPYPGGLDTLREMGFVIAGMALSPEAIPLDEWASALPERVALVLGTEGHGLTPQGVEACDLLVTIPMGNGIDSLNVAAASAVAFWATRPQA